MKITQTKVKDCQIIEMDRHLDDRGFFQEIYQEDAYPPFSCKQINWSHSHRNVLRGLHVAPYGKLVTCVSGRVWDVVVDCRSKSPTFLKWAVTELFPEWNRQILVPPNCGHGFLALEDNSTLIYSQTGVYARQGEFTLAYNEPNFNICWPGPYPGKDYILSERDRQGASLWEYFCCCEEETNWAIYDQVQQVWLDSLPPERKQSFLINTGKIKRERSPQSEFPSFPVEI